MTNFFLVYQPGRSGGSWLAAICSLHPARMQVIGEVHLPSELGIGRVSSQEHAQACIDFLKSQADQGKAAAGVLKSIRNPLRDFVLANNGRIAQLYRNPIEIVRRRIHGDGTTGSKMSAVEHYIGKKNSYTDKEVFEGHAIYYAKLFGQALARAKEFPFIRLTDLNRSLAAEGKFFKAVMEWLTQTEFPDEYIKRIQEEFLPGIAYPQQTIRNEQGIVTGTEVFFEKPWQPWRMNWNDDPTPRQFWIDWEGWQHDLFRKHLGEIATRLGYNCTTDPGAVDVDWEFKNAYPWSKYADELVPTPVHILRRSICIISPYRCGVQWLQNVLADLLYFDAIPRDRSQSVGEILEREKKHPGGRVYTGCFPLGDCEELAKLVDIVVMKRDPRDALVSAAYWYANRPSGLRLVKELCGVEPASHTVDDILHTLRERYDAAKWWRNYQNVKDIVPHALTSYENFEIPVGERYIQLVDRFQAAIKRYPTGQYGTDYCTDPIKYAQTLFLRRVLEQLDGRYPLQSDIVYHILGRHPFDKESGDDRYGEGIERVIRAQPPSNWRNYFSSSDNWQFCAKNPEAFEGYGRIYAWAEDRNV